MAKTRAQRKAEQRRRQAQQREGGETAAADEAKAQHDTQVPESAYEIEAELAEEGANLDELTGRPTDGAPAVAEPEPSVAEPAVVEEPADQISRRERRRAERERKAAAKESERRRAPKEETTERQRGAVIGFLVSCWAELKRVQWPDRETLIQASTITVVFIAILAAYLGVLDAIFNWAVKQIL
ncbi:MAG: preprotein translocase subunit SecE [Solirubrobacterales bacterium]